MDNSINRPVPIDRHPLTMRKYRIPTPSIAAMRDLIDECLFLYVSGATIEGRPRTGKSYAIEFMLQNLATRYPKMSVYRIRCKKPQAPSENTFFSSLLYAINHAAPESSSRAALRGRLIHKIRQVAETKGDHRVVLFADEAQNLREIEYEW
jgi:Cdc6-like AAA superfamily ATPase